MKDKAINIIFVLGFVIVVLASALSIFRAAPVTEEGRPIGSDIIAPTPFTSAATSGPITLTTTSQDILATNTSRSFVEIRTDTCGGGATLQLDRGIPAVANDGFNIGTTTGLSVFRLTGENLYRGAIAGIAKSGTCVLSVYER